MKEETKDVDVEPQRQALEDMSQQLLVRLNRMVQEQEQRASEFATRTHSLSSLPGDIELPKPPTLPEVAPQAAATAAQTQKKSVAPPPGVRRDSQSPAPSAPARESTYSQRPAPRRSVDSYQNKRDGKDEEKGIPLWITIGGWGLVVLLMRACS